MENQLLEFAKEHFYYILMACGLLIIIGSILDWKWITRISSPVKFGAIRTWIEEVYGIEARYRFERVIIFICGVVILVVGIIYWHYYHLFHSIAPKRF